MTLISANTATLLMGDSGSGKTSAAVAAAINLWNSHKKRTRLYCFDDGMGDLAISLREAGILDIWRPTSRDPDGSQGLPLATLQLATQGYWPMSWDSETGNSAPAGLLVAPSVGVARLLCPKGHTVAESPSTGLSGVPPEFAQGANCAECKVLVTVQTGRIEVQKKITPGFEDVGLVIFDGLSSMCDWAMQDVNVRSAKDQLGGEKGNIRTQESDGLLFGTSGRGGVGFIQNLIRPWIRNSLSIPGQARPPIFTALEMRGTDEGTVQVYGPQLMGKARTAEAPAWFGNTIGATIWEEAGKKAFRLWLRRYQDPGSSTPHLCKIRAVPGPMPEFLEDPSEAKDMASGLFTKFNLGYFYELLDKAAQETHGAIVARLQGAPEAATRGELPAEARVAIRTGTEGRVVPLVRAGMPTPAASPIASPVASPAGAPTPMIKVRAKPAPEPVLALVIPAPAQPAQAPAATPPAVLPPAPARPPAGGVVPPVGAPPVRAAIPIRQPQNQPSQPNQPK